MPEMHVYVRAYRVCVLVVRAVRASCACVRAMHVFNLCNEVNHKNPSHTNLDGHLYSSHLSNTLGPHDQVTTLDSVIVCTTPSCASLEVKGASS